MAVFDDQQSVAAMAREQLISYLEEIGDDQTAGDLKVGRAQAQSLGRLLGKAYANPEHVVGFIAPGDAGQRLRPVSSALMIEADPGLVGKRIKLTLDGFYVEEYPGTGQHSVALDFSGRDQSEPEAKSLRFATGLKVSDRSSANISGAPIFVGLKVPTDGMAFEFQTISVRNTGDDAIMAVLNGPLFKTGLSILSHVQPALPQLVGLAAGVTTSLINHRKNAQVQCFELGLDFSATPTSARLRCGSYVVMQVPDRSTWSWDHWTYSADTMSIIRADGTTVRAPYNTLIFSISESVADKAISARPPTGTKKG